MDNYAFFAPHYDSLMREVNYNERADYLIELFKRLNHEPGITLDVGCGTGTMTLLLKKRGLDIYGVDPSEQMLSEAMDKAYDMEEHVLFLRQKAENLNLYGTIQTAISTFDSLNHIEGFDALSKAFFKVGFFMDKGGYFVFDMNTVYKHKEVLSNNTFVYETDEVFCVWQNTFEEENDNKVSISLDFFNRDNDVYYRESTAFSEYAYSTEKIKEMLNRAGFELKAVYDDLSFDEPKEDSQRLIFVAQKIEEPGKKTF